MTRARKDEMTIERDILVAEVQGNKDIDAGDKDHLRHAINSAYAAVETDDISKLAASNIVWTRINLRQFASLQKLVVAVDKLSDEVRNHIRSAASSQPQAQAKARRPPVAPERFERRLNAMTRLARVTVWPAAVVVAIIATALILRPELARIAADVFEHAQTEAAAK